jgi:hypothetical protein
MVPQKLSQRRGGAEAQRVAANYESSASSFYPYFDMKTRKSMKGMSAVWKLRANLCASAPLRKVFFPFYFFFFPDTLVI